MRHDVLQLLPSLKPNVLALIMGLACLVNTVWAQDFNYLSLQQNPRSKVVRVYPGDSLTLIWNQNTVSGRISSISDSIISLNQTPYLLHEVEMIYVPRRSWGRQVLESAPPKMIQFGALLFIYGHLNRLVLEGKLIEERMYNTEVLAYTVLPAAIIHGILVNTRFRKFNPDKDRVIPVTFR